MSPFASAPWPLKALLGGLFGLAGLACVLAVGSAIALAGLGQFSTDLDPAAAPAWFWYFRGDPRVTRWLAIGISAACLAALVIGIAVLRAGRRPLHGAARWARP